jgi:hypothetical protein
MTTADPIETCDHRPWRRWAVTNLAASVAYHLRLINKITFDYCGCIERVGR